MLVLHNILRFASGRRLLTCAAGIALMLAAACTGSKIGPDAVVGLTPDGTVAMRQGKRPSSPAAVAAAARCFIMDDPIQMTVSGLGVGGIGASTLDADGEVYKLNRVSQLPGAYVQGRYGFAFGNKSGGDLWLQNESGVIMHLKANREG